MEIIATDAVVSRLDVVLTSSFDAAVSTLNICIVFCFRGLTRPELDSGSYTRHRPATKLKDKSLIVMLTYIPSTGRTKDLFGVR